MLRDNSYHALSKDYQKVRVEKFRNSRNFHGAKMSGNGKRGCNISFDSTLEENNQDHVKRRSNLSIVDPDQEE